MEKIKFNGKILIIGYGSVAQCTLPVLLEHLDVPREKITVIDFENKSEKIKTLLKGKEVSKIVFVPNKLVNIVAIDKVS